MTNKAPIDTWVIDCVDKECDGHMELREITQTTFSVENDGPSEMIFQAWCCDTCEEWITDIDRENREIEAYKIH